MSKQPSDKPRAGGDDERPRTRTAADDDIRTLFDLLQQNFDTNNAEVRLLAAMVQRRRLDKLSSEIQALEVQRSATETNCSLDYLIQRISVQNASHEVVIQYKRFHDLIANCFEPADLQNGIDQMRVLSNERHIIKYGTASVKVGAAEPVAENQTPAPRVQVTVAAAAAPANNSLLGRLARLYAPNPDPTATELRA